MRSRCPALLIFAVLMGALCLTPLSYSQSPDKQSLGVARIDITPKEPIRLSGYGSRSEPSDGVHGKLWAKAVAIGDGDEPAVFVTLDLIGVPDWLTAAVAEQLDLPASKVALCATHTHSGPHLRDVLNPIFMEDIPQAHWEVIERYSDQLIGKVVTVCQEAIDKRTAGSLAWGQGKVTFAGNRRVLENGQWTGFGIQPDGPVDHSLPVMKINDADGKLKAIIANYACHCTTLGGNFNHIHGDWAGEAQRLIEERHPGTTALIAIGCGADANPNPRGSMAEVIKNATELANEVDRLLTTEFLPLPPISETTLNHIDLPLDPLPSREEWETHAQSEEKTAYYAQQILKRLDAGEALPTSIHYPIQTWTFGNELAMVFLAGEVVVDYAIKLKERFDADRIWINAYANAAPSYIASRRLYDEGGYEVDRSMLYYDKPTRLSPDTEELVLDEVLKQLPYHYYSQATLNRIPAPIEKEQALATIKAHPDVLVELVAAEPLVMDPIDVAWGPDKRMWVVEMADYPLGINDEGIPGGRIRYLEDLDEDGTYDRSTLFLEDIPFPTSVLPWQDGVLITSPPNIIYATDTDGDGKADQQESLYTGFTLGNEQHLVNGLNWGLDGWIYLANGDSGGVVKATGSTQPPIDINGRDLRIHPATGQIEAIEGRSQFGRNRDAWGNWFGNSNSWPGWHFALEDQYLKRNPYVTYPTVRSYLPEEPQAGPVYPISKTLSRYNDYEKANRFTSACGYIVYEDQGLGDSFIGNSFVAEPVHNLVSRGVLNRKGTTFESKRAPEETNTEFLASTDNWFRPTSIRSGPDGALYVTDMYRLVIEHPEWVPLDWQRKLNLREGHDKGRIYRISGKDLPRRTVPDLTQMDTAALVQALDSDNRWQRDGVQQLLLGKPAPSAAEALSQLAIQGNHPEARAQALWTLYTLNSLTEELLLAALNDPDTRVIRQAVRLSADMIDQQPQLLENVIELAQDNDMALVQQVAYTLGESQSEIAAHALAQILLSHSKASYIRAAALSSILPHADVLARDHTRAFLNSGDRALIEGFLQTIVGSKSTSGIADVLPQLIRRNDLRTMNLAAIFLRTLRDQHTSLAELYSAASSKTQNSLDKFQVLFDHAGQLVSDPAASLSAKRTALSLLSYPQVDGAVNGNVFLDLLTPATPVELQLDAIEYLARSASDNLVSDLMGHWSQAEPRIRKALIDTLLKRQPTTYSLLDYASSHPHILPTFSPSQIISLTTYSNSHIRETASRLFKANVSKDRLQTIKSFEPALDLTGDNTTGRAVFEARCSICHQVDGFGHTVGPDLVSLSDKSAESLLIGILDPNRSLEAKYALYTLSTQNGETATGIIADESSTSIRLLNAGGIEQTVLRTQIQSMDGGSRSLMPEGLEVGLDHQSMADLLAFVADKGQTLTVQADVDGSYGLSAQEATISGATAFYNPATRTVDAVSDSDAIQWTVRDLKAGYYDIFSDAALAMDYSGRPFTLTVNDDFVTGAISYTGGIDRYRKRKFGNIQIDADLETAVITLEHQLDGPHLSLHELRLIPVH